MKLLLTFTFTCFLSLSMYCQTEIFPTGSFIIDMGNPTQTIGNGLKPYGLVYELLKTHHVPVKWVIAKGKLKDGKDFSYGGSDYKGGTFVIPADYINSTVSNRIAAWTSMGVAGKYTTSAITLTVTQTLTSVPNWTLNPVNVSISKSFFTDAGIPSSAYTTANATGLGACNDIFVMPHADPTWANHGNLYDWNRNYMGAIWAGCHAVSVLESLVNPLNSNEQMNFLSTKGLTNYNSHNDGSAPFSYFFNRGNYNGAPISARPDDAVFQMMGKEDLAHTNGSEQVYIPSVGSSWRNTTHIGCYDSIQSNVNANASNGPAAITLYGRGFGLNTSGYVMYQGGHDIEGSNEYNISAVRQFFNFSLMVMSDKVPQINTVQIPQQIQEGTTYQLKVNAYSPAGATLSYQWIASCPGTFSQVNSASTLFTPDVLNKNSSYTITCVVTDACSRYTFHSSVVTAMAALPVNILNFSAVNVGEDAKIQWTSFEENSLGQYELYRSTDGHNYTMVGEIQVDDQHSELKKYNYLDPNIVSLGVHSVYYQLKLVNLDSSYKWSSILKVGLNPNNTDLLKLKVFPNPCNELLSVAFEGSDELEYTIEVNDAFGKQILEISPERNLDAIDKVDLTMLQKGIYILQINCSDGRKISQKFIKN